MTRILTIYPNCSMGGMTTVYKNRISSNPLEFHHLVFKHDHGARGVYDELQNARVDIPAHGRLDAYVRYIYQACTYDEVRVTSLPETANFLLDIDPARVVYEFHSSSESVISSELDKLNLNKLLRIEVPSQFLRELVMSLMPAGAEASVYVVENLIDANTFQPGMEDGAWNFAPNLIPLVWIGRFDKGKNPRDFLRILSLLPQTYLGVVVVSMETDPDRASAFFADIASYGLDDRVKLMMNLQQDEIASLYRFVASRHGAFVSTSLGESFGYGVAEALACGLDTVAYRVGALAERTANENGRYILVDVGDIRSMQNEILGIHKQRSSAKDWTIARS